MPILTNADIISKITSSSSDVEASKCLEQYIFSSDITELQGDDFLDYFEPIETAVCDFLFDSRYFDSLTSFISWKDYYVFDYFFGCYYIYSIMRSDDKDVYLEYFTSFDFSNLICHPTQNLLFDLFLISEFKTSPSNLDFLLALFYNRHSYDNLSPGYDSFFTHSIVEDLKTFLSILRNNDAVEAVMFFCYKLKIDYFTILDSSLKSIIFKKYDIESREFDDEEMCSLCFRNNLLHFVPFIDIKYIKSRRPELFVG